MNFFTFIVMVSMQSAAPPSVIADVEMIDSLRRGVEFIDDRVVKFEVAHWSGSGSSTVPEVRNDRLIMHTRNETRMHESKYHFELEFLDTHKNLLDLKGDRRVDTWNGAQARTMMIDANPLAERTMLIAAEPLRDHWIQHFLTWQGWWVFQGPTRITFYDLLANYRLFGPTLIADGRTEWICSHPDLPNAQVKLYAIRGQDGNPFLDSAIFELFRSGDNSRTSPVATNSIAFSDYRPGIPLAYHAVLQQSHFAVAKDDVPSWSYTTIELIDVVSSIDGDDYIAAIAPPMSVSDTRYRIAYRIGDNAINYDGRAVDVESPLNGDVGETLEHWFESAKFGPILDANTGERLEELESSNWSVAGRFGLVGVCTFGLLAIIRLNRTRKSKRLFVGLVVISSLMCEISCSKNESGTNSDQTSFNGGRVSIDAGPVMVKHDFEIKNRSNQTMKINTVKKSCGCVDASVSRMEVPAGESALLTIGVTVQSVGTVSHGATAIFDDDTYKTFTVTAVGALRFKLEAFRKQPEIDQDGRMNVRLFLTDTDGAGETGDVSVVSPVGVNVMSQGWVTLERGNSTAARPTTQLNNVVLDFANYAGSYPVKIGLRTEHGYSCEISASAAHPHGAGG